MKKFWVMMVIIALAAVFPVASDAQSPYYNTRSKSSSDSSNKSETKPSLFNSWGSGRSSSGPMNLNKKPRNNAKPLLLTNYTSSGYGSNFYGGENNRPPGISRNNYALRISEEQIAAERAERDQMAQKQLTENISSTEDFENIMAFANGQRTGSQKSGQGSSSKKPKVFLYKKRTDDQGKPKKVFNSIY